MLSRNLNTILNSYVSEHAYLPFMSPVSACVCSKGLKGSFRSLFKQFSYSGSSCGFFARSFPAFLRNAGEKSNSSFIPYCLHSLFYRFETNWDFFFGFQNPVNKSFVPFLFFKNVSDKIPYLDQSRLRKFWQQFFNMVYFINRCIHENIIAQLMSGISQENGRQEAKILKLAACKDIPANPILLVV